jgi:hypothetical protein
MGSARLDEIISDSESSGVYLKMCLFGKNDAMLNRIQSDGTTGTNDYPDNFYSGAGEAVRWYEEAYARYWVARWSYSTAVHSVELANENNLDSTSYNAAYAVEGYIDSITPRHILLSNSFWGYWVNDFWASAPYASLMDYSDQHYYANHTGSAGSISSLWTDSAAYARETAIMFDGYRTTYTYTLPIVRGEAGVAVASTMPQDPAIADEATGVYYHKALWSNLGAAGNMVGGEWYPRLFVAAGEAYPNGTYSTFKTYKAYADFLEGEPLSNGHYGEIGTDLTTYQHITTTNAALRSWGLRDAEDGKVVLWIDNANDTWVAVSNTTTITPVTGSLVLVGLPPGTYTARTWNTISGTVTLTDTYEVAVDGLLTFPVTSLGTDVAVKFVLNDVLEPTPTPTNGPSPTPTMTPIPSPTPGGNSGWPPPWWPTYWTVFFIGVDSD